MKDYRIGELANSWDDGSERRETLRADYEPIIPHGDEEAGGAVAGGVIGAVAGAFVGGPVGAVVGGAIGAFSGAAVGAGVEADEEQREDDEVADVRVERHP
ncbi:MAG: glycine zipper domain-containing protein [Candidatus Limnocylindrales bacterium]|jgi:outer membrane lipoprotein SlyB